MPNDLLPQNRSMVGVSILAGSSILDGGGFAVRKNRFAGERIFFVLQQAEHGSPVR